MAQIVVERDPDLKFDEIVVPIFYPQATGSADISENRSGVQQTKFYGIYAPLVQVNNILIDYPDIIDITLKCTGNLPELSLFITDRYGLLTSFANPGADNSIVIQILPKFEDAYKKIQLKFYISSYRQSGDYIQINGIYNIPELYISRLTSLGRMNTYQLADWVSRETSLGLASNVKENMNDERWIYFDNRSIIDLLGDHIKKSGDASGRIILDWWVDFWNYFTLCDVYERWTAKDPADEMKSWITGQINEYDPNVEVTPYEVQVIFSNLYVMRNTELYVTNYRMIYNTGACVSGGTDKCYGVWLDDRGDWTDKFIQDGDVKRDIYLKYEYLGENWEDGSSYDYMMMPSIHDAFVQKMNYQIIEINLQTPFLGINRGSQVRFNWYKDNDMWTWKRDQLNENGVTRSSGISDIEQAVNESGADGSIILDEKISGQYTVIGEVIHFNNQSGWNHSLMLSRPQSEIPQLLNDKSIESN